MTHICTVCHTTFKADHGPVWCWVVPILASPVVIVAWAIGGAFVTYRGIEALVGLLLIWLGCWLFVIMLVKARLLYRPACTACRSRDIIPIETPRGRQLEALLQPPKTDPPPAQKPGRASAVDDFEAWRRWRQQGGQG